MKKYRLEVLADLADEVARKRSAPPAESYTAKLISQGALKCAKKFGEEAVELALASVASGPSEMTAEAADVLYHLIVLLEAKGIQLADVMAELERRRGTGGLVEKAARKAD